MERLTVLLVMLPLLSASVITARAGALGKRVAWVSVSFSLLTLLLAVAVLVLDPGTRPLYHLAGSLPWGTLYVDKLGEVMAVLVSGISLVVRIYSVRYMAEEPGYARFFALLDLMAFAILLMVFAGDLITLLIAWHLVGLLLYFLLGHDLGRPVAERYAFWTYFTYRVGDLPLILAAILLYQGYGTVSLPSLFAHIASSPQTPGLFGMSLPLTVGFLVGLSAFARSAQFPLNSWLPYTMEGPTPVSVLMHAGIVNAGGFIINRFAPVFVYAGPALHLIFAVGLVTALLGSALMLTQNDVKKALGYSTMGQMGFMLVECGVGAFPLAIYHLIAHGVFKGTLFLGAGNVIGSARQQDGVPHDDVYTFVVERRPAGGRQPWILAAAITVVVPFVILALSHWLVGGNFVVRQGAVVLLFFGWVTGAQLLFVTYRLRADNPWRLMSWIIVSLTIVVAGYTVMEHAFGLMLYPNHALIDRIYAAASIRVSTFEGLMSVIAVAAVIGWFATFYSGQERNRNGNKVSAAKLALYSLISREFYVSDVYAWLTHVVLGLSRRLNLWLRWV
ncbi:MAG: proton-conducting transporter transmembrane domain-containing protein [Acidiferrobacteraceae bacterium]